jgi:hypothetical protein
MTPGVKTSMAEPSAHTENTDGANLRHRLLAAEPMHRVAALHDLECLLARTVPAPNARLAQAIQDFVARGMPFYSDADPHYLEWVDRAVDYWQRLNRGTGSDEAGTARRRASAAVA